MDAGMPDDESYPASLYELLELPDGCNYVGRVAGRLSNALDIAIDDGLIIKHSGGFALTEAGRGARARHREHGATRQAETHQDLNPTVLEALKYVPLPPDGITGDALAAKVDITPGHLRKEIVTLHPSAKISDISCP
jgi:hypothetical protein